MTSLGQQTRSARRLHRFSRRDVRFSLSIAYLIKNNLVPEAMPLSTNSYNGGQSHVRVPGATGSLLVQREFISVPSGDDTVVSKGSGRVAIWTPPARIRDPLLKAFCYLTSLLRLKHTLPIPCLSLLSLNGYP